MSAIEEMLAEARRDLERVRPQDLEAALIAGALVVDIRPERYRIEEGTIPGSIAIERNVLEWRLDPTGPDAIPEAEATSWVILVCNEGYASSLAAQVLRHLGISRATDLDGGYRAWLRRSGAVGPS
jgi:rhodanese-related sulfurtransferase